MIKVFTLGGQLIVGTEGVYPLVTMQYSLTGGLLTIFSPYVNRENQQFNALYNIPFSQIQDEQGNGFSSESDLGDYLATEWQSLPLATLSASERSSIVADAMANNKGVLPSAPASPQVGDFWYDLPSNSLKIQTPSGVETIDIKGDLIIQDLAGNTITTD